MKRAIVILVLFALPLMAQLEWKQQSVDSVHQTPAAAGGSPAAFSDAFTRADNDSLGANWTEADADIDITSNTAQLQDGSFAEMFAIYTGTACSTVNQYVQLRVTVANGFPQIPIRYTSSGTEFYFIEFSGSTADWYHSTGIAGTDTQINAGSGSISLTAGTVLSITITGTGSSTTVRIWDDVTSGTTPTAAGTWNGDSTPDVTFTDDPGDPVDAGTFVGIGGVAGGTDGLSYDDFFGGDIP